MCAASVAWPERFWGPEQFDAQAWSEMVGDIDAHEESEAIVAALGGVASVVDVGGGTGLITRAVAARVAPVIVVEPDAMQRAGLPDQERIWVVEGRAESVPLAAREVDAGLATWVLQYTSDPAAAVRELARVARRRVVIVQAAPANQLVEVYNLEAGVAGQAAAHHGWLLAQAAEILEAAGFTVELQAVPTVVAGRDAAVMADMLARLHFAGHPRLAAMRAATEPFIAERLARQGHLRDDAVMLVARRV